MYNAIRYEITRLTSLRSTWVLFGTGLALQAVIAYTYARHSDMTPSEQFVASSGLLMLVTLCSTAIAVGAFGHEYRYRTMTTTMLTLRRPGRVLAAKAVTAGGVAALSGAGLVGITLMVQTFFAEPPAEIGRITQVLGAVVAYSTLAALVGLGIAAVTRNATFAMVAAIGIPTILESAAMLGGVSPRLLPFTSAAQLLHPADGNVALMALPLLLVAGGLLATSGVLLARRDV